MKKTFVIVLAFFAFLPAAYGATPSLWAMNVGTEWSGVEKSYIIDPFTFGFDPAMYPTNGLVVIWDAAYQQSTSTVYVSGGLLHGLTSSAIAVYQGVPESLTFSSLSEAGMTNRDWLAGIELIDGILYGVCETDLTGDTIFVRIDNPGLPSQTLTQIGPSIGLVSTVGHAFALCKDGQSGLIASIGQSLYNVDVQTGNAVLLHTYSSNDFLGAIEGLTLFEERLFGVITSGKLYEIDRNTWELNEVANLGDFMWTALVAVPEPSMILCMAFGILLFFRRRYK